MRYLWSFILGFAMLVLCESSVGATPDKLVEQLGSESYRLREQASQQLRAMKRAAVSALERGLTSQNLEVRGRCRAILRAVQMTPEEIRLRSFVDGRLATLPGWERFEKVAGPNRDARALFASICRVDRGLLEKLQRDPKQAKAITKSLASRLNREISKMTPQQAIGKSAGLVYAASLVPSLDDRTFGYVYNVLRRNEVTGSLGSNPIIRKLLEKLVAQQSNSRNYYQQVSLAQSYRLTKYIHGTLAGQLKKKLAEALRGNDNNSFYRIQSVASRARQVGLTELIEDEIKPAIEKWARRAAGKADINKLYAIVNLSRTINLEPILADVLRPAFSKWLETTSDPLSSGRAYMLTRVAQALDLEGAAASRLGPILEARMLAVTLEPDYNEISRLASDAQTLGMQKTADAFLSMASEKLMLDVVKKGGEFSDIQRIVNLSRRLNLDKEVDAILKPYVRSKARSFAKKKVDLQNAYNMFNLARQLNMQKAIDEEIEPAIDRVFRELAKRPINRSSLYQALSLAESLQSKSAVAYALRAATSKSLDTRLKARAIYTVGKVGGKEHIDDLAGLVKNTSSIGVRTINRMKVATTLGDVALAAMIHLSGQSLQKYGFDYAVTYRREYPTISYYYLGFGSNQKRQQAVSKWQLSKAK